MTGIANAARRLDQENALVTAIRAAADCSADLHILDRTDGSWDTRAWADVVATAEAVAARLESMQRAEIPEPVAVISEATFETIAVVLASWMAGRASTILPGPNRFASLDSWAERTGEILRLLGVREVFSQGTAIKALDARLGSNPDIRLTEVNGVAEWPTAPATFDSAVRPLHEAAIYQGTAGSTGVPKCVQLTGSAVLHNVRAVLERQNYRHGEDILCSWLPLYHDMGLMMMLAGMVSGAPTWLAPTSAFAKSPFDWLGWLDHSRATVTAAPNFAYALLGRYARVANTADLSALRVAVNGGEPIDVEATERFSVELKKFGFDPRAVSCSYGLAEATCALTMPAPGASSGLIVDEVPGDGAAMRKVALLGTAINGVEIRIAPTDHRTDFHDVRGVGEIEFRSAAQMMGYVGEQPIDPGAWIKTGDLGYLVGDQLVVCGRSKELITIAGRNVFPQEVERAAAAVPGVRLGSVAAVGGRGSQARRDQLVIVAEYVGDDPQTARRSIIDLVTAQCGTTPATVDFVEAGTLPKTTSGKLRRTDIAARYR
jgi:long-chain-fatty-acid--[acyl-carrier-protein] ligase